MEKVMAHHIENSKPDVELAENGNLSTSPNKDTLSRGIARKVGAITLLLVSMS